MATPFFFSPAFLALGELGSNLGLGQARGRHYYTSGVRVEYGLATFSTSSIPVSRTPHVPSLVLCLKGQGNGNQLDISCGA